jgi:hypothetical protein
MKRAVRVNINGAASRANAPVSARRVTSVVKLRKRRIN